MTKDDNYMAMLLEEIRDQNRAVLESVGQIQDTIKTLAIQESLDTLGNKVDTIQHAVTATNQDMNDPDRRVTLLEQAA